MRTDETSIPGRIAMQPETRVEQSLLSEMFVRLQALSDAPDHPTKIGTELVFYTLDLAGYSDLDLELADEAGIDIDDHGKIDPEPGSRALVVIYDQDAHKETGDSDGNATKEDANSDNTLEGNGDLEETPDVGDLEPVDDGDEQEKAEFHLPEGLLEVMETEISKEEPDYDTLVSAAKECQEHGINIAANLSTEKFVEEFDDLLDKSVSADMPA